MPALVLPAGVPVNRAHLQQPCPSTCCARERKCCRQVWLPGWSRDKLAVLSHSCVLVPWRLGVTPGRYIVQAGHSRRRHALRCGASDSQCAVPRHCMHTRAHCLAAPGAELCLPCAERGRPKSGRALAYPTRCRWLAAIPTGGNSETGLCAARCATGLQQS